MRGAGVNPIAGGRAASGWIGMVTGLCALSMVACSGPLPVERPREGAPTGVDAQAASADRDTGPPPTLSPFSPASPAVVVGSPGSVASPSPSPSPSPVAGYVIVATDGAGANVRSAPSTSAPVVTTLREGTPVEVIGEPVNSEGRAWRQIRSGSYQGWVVAVVVRPR
ncbi:MAG: SH3 domain-containing protein [Chloroflexota bacterium]